MVEFFFIVVLPIVVGGIIFAINPVAFEGSVRTNAERNRRRRHLKATRDSRPRCHPGERSDLPWR